ncbi:MAG: hypothetical protein IPL55_19760 [Saprospiraceae bacterium]|jgi:exonuclease VII large subunit|nr:hypothetical protein [Saprospiraceae bacterium]
MSKFFTTFCIILLSQFTFAQKLVSIDSISTHIGENIKVCDKVAGTFVTKSDKPLTYLNLGADFPNAKLTIVIFQQDLVNFPLTPSDHYKGMNICITGELTIYKDRPQIIANKPEQIELI